jgi:hypothetical protein
LFKVNNSQAFVPPPGYVKVNELRQYWQNSTKFDDYLKEIILLKEGVATQEHH